MVVNVLFPTPPLPDNIKILCFTEINLPLILSMSVDRIIDFYYGQFNKGHKSMAIIILVLF
jgi:hypothetical protein